MVDASETVRNLNNTADYTEEYDPNDIQNNQLMAILAYIWLLVLVPIFMAKESKFARFHANQGLVLCIASIALGIISASFCWIPVVKYIVSIICGLAGLGVLILAILGIVNAAQGRAKELPIVGKFRILK